MGNSNSNPSAAAVEASVHVGGLAPDVAGVLAPGKLGRVRNGHPPLEATIGGSRLSLKTHDGFKLDALYVESQKLLDSNPWGVIIFHGNAMCLDAMGVFAQFYQSRGIHVLLVTMRGYPGSEGDVRTEGEPGIYFDVAAAVDFMITKKMFSPQHLIAHGFSLGGSLAAAAAVHHKLGGLVLDHTFTSAAAVAQHNAVCIVAQHVSKWIPQWMSASVAEGAMNATFVAGNDVQLGRAGCVKTDGLSSLNKVKHYNGRLVLIYGTDDTIIPTSHADEFEEAYGGSSFTRVEVKGGTHNDCNHFRNTRQCNEIARGLALPTLKA
jgi:pimeloyl-ACP methyl ester carboxylesterase